MPIIPRLIDLYQKRGHEIAMGIGMQVARFPYSDFTHIVSSDNELTKHLGIALQEIYFFEHLFSAIAPKKIFIVGNSFGWSTFAMAMLAPQAQITAIELSDEPFTAKWLDRTNQIATEEGFNVKVFQGRSPNDIDRVVAQAGGGPFDLVFIDGHHTDEQVVLDFRGIQKHTTDSTLVLLHDVLMLNLVKGVDQIVREAALVPHVLWRTTSGMVMLRKDGQHNDLIPLLAAFGQGPHGQQLLQRLRQAQQQRTQQQTQGGVTYTVMR